MFKFRLSFLICLFLYFSNSLFAQEEVDMKTFVAVIKKKSEIYKDNLNFCKAQSFFLTKQWDSTLFYSMRQLNSESNNELRDYCHYFRATSFLKKNF